MVNTRVPKSLMIDTVNTTYDSLTAYHSHRKVQKKKSAFPSKDRAEDGGRVERWLFRGFTEMNCQADSAQNVTQ